MKSVMVVIWYNPDVDRYELGHSNDFITRTTSSLNPDRYLILYEFDPVDYSSKLATRVIKNLNLARSIAPKHQEFFA